VPTYQCLGRLCPRYMSHHVWAGASALRASSRMRLTMDLNPFDRWGEGEVLAKSEAVEQRQRVDIENVLRRLTRVNDKQHRNQPAYDVGIAVAGKAQDRPTMAAAFGAGQSHTWLAQPETLLAPVCVVSGRARAFFPVQ
jgi:hypothetical protein